MGNSFGHLVRCQMTPLLHYCPHLAVPSIVLLSFKASQQGGAASFKGARVCLHSMSVSLDVTTICTSMRRHL